MNYETNIINKNYEIVSIASHGIQPVDNIPQLSIGRPLSPCTRSNRFRHIYNNQLVIKYEQRM